MNFLLWQQAVYCNIACVLLAPISVDMNDKNMQLFSNYMQTTLASQRNAKLQGILVAKFAFCSALSQQKATWLAENLFATSHFHNPFITRTTLGPATHSAVSLLFFALNFGFVYTKKFKHQHPQVT